MYKNEKTTCMHKSSGQKGVGLFSQSGSHIIDLVLVRLQAKSAAIAKSGNMERKQR